MKTKTFNGKRFATTMACAFAVATASNARTFRVSEGESIQDAIDAAALSPGADTVLLRSGTYEEYFEIEDPDPLTLRGTGAVTIDGNDEDEDVIKISGGRVTIQNITITGGDDGIDASGSDAEDFLTLINVDASDNADEGVEAGKIESVAIKNSTFSDNGGDGVNVEKALTLIVINVSSNANDDGFDIEVVGSVIMHNVDAAGNEDEGLEVDDTESVELTHGRFNLNSDEGIDIDNTKEIRLISVEATGNVGSGFQAEADEVDVQSITVIGGTFADNGEDGIQFLGEAPNTIGDVTLKAVRCRNNVDNGLDIQASGTVTLKAVSSGIAQGNGAEDVLP